MANKKHKTTRMFAKLLSGIIVIVALVGLAFIWGGNSGMPEISENINTFEKIRGASNNGTKLILKEQDVNYLLQLALPKGYATSSLAIRGIYTKIQNNQMKLNIPVQYKGIKLLLHANIELSYISNQVVINPLSFQVGMVPIPKSIVMDVIKSKANGKLEIADNKILININTETMPFAMNVQALNLENDGIAIVLPKDNITNKLESLLDEELRIYNKDASIEQDSNKNTSDTKNPNVSGNPSNSTIPTTSTHSTQNTNTAAKIKAAEINKILNHASGQLNVAASKLGSAKTKQVLAAAKATLGKMAGNSSYNYQKDLYRVKVLYDSLTDQEKEKLKAAIFQSVDTKALLKVYNSK